MLRLTDPGGKYLLDVLFKDIDVPVNYYVQLISDSVALLDSDVAGSHTAIDIASYDIKAADGVTADNAYLEAADCTISLSAALIPTATWALKVFSFKGQLAAGASVVGYRVIPGDASNIVIWEEILDTPYKPMAAGDLLKIQFKIEMGNGIAL